MSAQPSSQQESRLLALPAELRNQIFALALAQPEPIDPLASDKADKTNRLTQVNRQIRQETDAVYFHKNVFRFTPSKEDIIAGYPRARSWLSEIVGIDRIPIVGGIIIDIEECWFRLELEHYEIRNTQTFSLVLKSLEIKSQQHEAQLREALASTAPRFVLPARPREAARLRQIRAVGYAPAAAAASTSI